VDDDLFRTVMAATPAPVTVVTTLGADRPAGCTVSAFMSLSLSPRLVAVALNSRSSMLAEVQTSQRLGVNILARGQADVAVQFASSAAKRFDGMAWWLEDGLPRLYGTAAWLSCRLASVVDAGDHRLLMAEVVGAAHSRQPPMVYAERLFGGHSGLVEKPPASLAEQLVAAAP
jgi:flavin reductase (DIM6/NTAB) family NADH-FMN oxidoreductase RutF